MIKRIVICTNCKGSGKIEQSELIDYHHHISDYWEEPCTQCNGHGRLVEEVSIRKLNDEEIKLNEREKNEFRN